MCRRPISVGRERRSEIIASCLSLEIRDYAHNVIDHAEAYVNGEVHTNTVENFWSVLKRALNGTYISVEPFHLFRYLDEQAFRFNNRKGMNDADRFSLAITGILGRRLTYKDLIGAGRIPSLS